MDDVKLWVRDSDRACLATFGTENHAGKNDQGYREVTASEQDEFRAQTKRDNSGPPGSLKINATGAEIAQFMREVNKQ